MLTNPYNNLQKSMYQFWQIYEQLRAVPQTTLTIPINLSKIQQEDWRTEKARQWPDLGPIKTIFVKGHTMCILLKFFRIGSFCFLNMKFSGPLKSEPVVSCASVTRCNILLAVLLVITAYLLQVSHLLCSLDIANTCSRSYPLLTCLRKTRKHWKMRDVQVQVQVKIVWFKFGKSIEFMFSWNQLLKNCCHVREKVAITASWLTQSCRASIVFQI